jgi:mono/diheme cytochrome c family protein
LNRCIAALARDAAVTVSLLAITQTAFAQTAAPAPRLRNAETYRAACASCHAPGVAPALAETNSVILAQASAHVALTEGRQHASPTPKAEPVVSRTGSVSAWRRMKAAAAATGTRVDRR